MVTDWMWLEKLVRDREKAEVTDFRFPAWATVTGNKKYRFRA